ncbi:MAG TPA: hypothetical protein VK430_11135 [Xanthobacteraceae bacterium]|nr:hypothetical protein [Xanthobacteraceae bacterium]
MLDIVKTAAGKSFLPLLAWIFPSALAILALWFITVPMIRASGYPVPNAIDKLTGAEAVSWLTGLSIALGVVLYVMSTPLYRLLEGYSWPKFLREWAVNRQKRKYEALRNTIDRGIPGQEWELGLALERLARYPSDIKQIAPTGFANALRSFETYGVNRFKLDSQIMWTELWSSAPEQTRAEYEGAKAFVDLFVATFYLSLAFTILSLVIIVLNAKHALLDAIAVVIPLAIAAYSYRMANVASTYWSATVKALVNIGRKPLAQSLGLDLPATLAEEREMWESVVGYIFYGPTGGSGYGRDLDKFRAKPKEAETDQKPADE